MNWFWLNIPLGAVFFLAIAGIPLWMVIRHPDHRPTAIGKDARAQAGTVTVAGMTARPAAPAEIRGRRDLADATAGDRS